MDIRRMVWLMLLSFTLIIGIVACNGNDPADDAAESDEQGSNENGSEEGQASDEVITLQLWGGVPPEAGPQDLIDAWNEENPDVQVEYTRFVNDDDGNLRLNTALQTGQDVDLFISYGPARLEERVDSDFVLNLDQYDDYDIEEKMGPEAEDYKFDDSFYAVPTKRDAMFIWLNKDALDEAGLPVPEEWTWEELQEYAQELTTDDRWGYVHIDWAINNMISDAVAFDGLTKDDGTSNYDHPNVEHGLQVMNEMMNEDQSMPTLGEQISSGLPVDQMFLNGEAAMFKAGDWIFRMANDLDEYPRDFEIAFAPFPVYEGQGNVSSGLGDAVSITNSTEYQDEAWEFVKWYADEGMVEQARGGRIPASQDAALDEALEVLIEGVEDTYDVESLERVVFSEEHGHLSEPTPVQVEDANQEEYERYLLGDQSLEDTIEAMVERHNQYLGRD